MLTLPRLLYATVLVAALAGPTDWLTQTPLPVTGDLTFYDYRVMPATEDYRATHAFTNPATGVKGIIPRCPECVGSMAMMRAGDIGRKVWLQIEGTISGPWLVIDCAQKKHFSNLIKLNRAGEIGREKWDDLDLPGHPVTVTILAAPPPITEPAVSLTRAEQVDLDPGAVLQRYPH